MMNEISDLKEVDMWGKRKVRIEGRKNLVDAGIEEGVEDMEWESIGLGYEGGNGLGSEDRGLD